MRDNCLILDLSGEVSSSANDSQEIENIFKINIMMMKTIFSLGDFVASWDFWTINRKILSFNYYNELNKTKNISRSKAENIFLRPLDCVSPSVSLVYQNNLISNKAGDNWHHLTSFNRIRLNKLHHHCNVYTFLSLNFIKSIFEFIILL